MRVFDHVIVGGGIAGTTAAETIRARAAQATIAIIGAEPYRLYSRVLLPHVLRGKSTEAQTFLRSEGSYDEKRITFLPGIAVASVDASARVLKLSDGEEIGYGTSLLIATGGSVRRLACPGAEEADPLYFQTLDDMRRIAATAARSAVVYGGGFIALELHMSLAHMGVRTTAAMRGEGFFGRTLGARGSERLAAEFAKRDIPVRTGEEIRAIETLQGGAKRVHLSGGDALPCDAVAVGIGLIPNVAFLAGSAITVGAGVVTDDHLRASVPGVFAAGDVAEHPDPWSGQRRVTGNWQNAMFQGKVAGENMTGGDAAFAALTSYSISCFGLPIAAIGAAESDGPGFERIVRDGMDATLQLVLKDGCAVAATSVGPFPDRAAITKLITGRVPFTSSMRAAIGDARIRIDSLVP